MVGAGCSHRLVGKRCPNRGSGQAWAPASPRAAHGVLRLLASTDSSRAESFEPGSHHWPMMGGPAQVAAGLRVLTGWRSPAVNHEAALSTLNDLIETSQVGERGFALATKDNHEPGIVDVLKEGEESCRTAAVELQDQVRLLGGVVRDRETLNAAVYRGWISSKAVPIARDTKLILEECERGEDYAKSRYENAMKVELPEAARAIVEGQYKRLIAIHGRVRMLRNRYPATEIPRGMDARSSDNRRN